MSTPTTLYNYMTAEHALALLVHSRIKLSTPAYLNDAFELLPGHVPPLPATPGWNPEAAQQGYKMMNDQNRTRLLVFCASADPDIHLCWAHYADKHRGIAIGLGGTHPIAAYARIQYTDNRPIIDSNTKAAVREAYTVNPYTTKYTAWKDEKEYRRFFAAPYDDDIERDNGLAFLRIAREEVTEIIFGLNCEPAVRRTISAVAAAGGFCPALKSISLHPTTYALNVNNCT